ncbi:glycosyltransferase family 2 protein [Salinigranum marinum]|uniref:glycosyltransferase family 2 protein n=1 Tax=Salinigranum marinum TaxID=1515595 RepID=UPI002989C8BA|nr:glycosyltransferase [Salinigranum marinum]
MDISVVVPTLKHPDEIEVVECLKRGEFEDYEVLIQDEYPVTKARNEGVRAAQSDKIVFLDDDSRPREDYLSRVSEALETEVALAGRTIHPRDDVFARELATHYDFGDSSRYVTRFWGCNMALRKEVLEAVGGWDENMGWGHEEKELADRVIEEHQIYYDPEIVVYHPYADSVRGYWKKQYKLEKQTPYYWCKRGVRPSKQWYYTLKTFVNPRGFVRRTPKLTLIKLGGTLASGSGRLVGLVSGRSCDKNET